MVLNLFSKYNFDAGPACTALRDCDLDPTDNEAKHIRKQRCTKPSNESFPIRTLGWRANLADTSARIIGPVSDKIEA